VPIYTEKDPLGRPPRAITAAFGGDWKPPAREKAEGKGQAMEGGSFPIKDAADLKRAVKAYGRAKDKAAAKAHIIKRAKALKLTNELPEGWVVVTKTASAGPPPFTPPEDWFTPPPMSHPHPLTIDDNGRIYRHIGDWATPHIGLPGNVKLPRSRSDYSFFKTGVLRTASGKDTPVGQLTVAGGHATLQADAGAAVQHYDDTASAVADVNVGEDKHGIWVAGALRPTATRAQVRALRASAPSGDWRPINGSLELVAICQVNVPGFPIARARVASGTVMALVAAGAGSMYRRRIEEMAGMSDLQARVASLEAADRDRVRQALRDRVAAK
jgi:hypothetical protein